MGAIRRFGRAPTERLASGMPFQVDVIPVPMPDNWALNCEDSVTFADAALRAELARALSGCPCPHRGAARLHGRRNRRRAEAVDPAALLDAALPAALLAGVGPAARPRVIGRGGASPGRRPSTSWRLPWPEYRSARSRSPMTPRMWCVGSTSRYPTMRSRSWPVRPAAGNRRRSE